MLPLATHSMYTRLGVGWATSVIGFASLAMIPIPFVFIWLGAEIRARSAFCNRITDAEKSVIDDAPAVVVQMEV